jgi:hypothetical protein
LLMMVGLESCPHYDVILDRSLPTGTDTVEDTGKSQEPALNGRNKPSRSKPDYSAREPADQPVAPQNDRGHYDPGHIASAAAATLLPRSQGLQPGISSHWVDRRPKPLRRAPRTAMSELGYHRDLPATKARLGPWPPALVSRACVYPVPEPEQVVSMPRSTHNHRLGSQGW